MNRAELIESAIQQEEWMRSTAAQEDQHFWDGWTPEAVRNGRLVASVTTSATATGHIVIVTRRLIVQSEAGKALAYVPDTEHTERVAARDI